MKQVKYPIGQNRVMKRSFSFLFGDQNQISSQINETHGIKKSQINETHGIDKKKVKLMKPLE